jgi:methyl-accepting chemotaxis protein
MKINVGKKIILGFFTLVVLMGVLSGFNFNCMSVVKGKIDLVIADWMPSVDSINNINFQTEHIYMLTLKHIISTSQSEKSSIETERSKSIHEVSDALDAYGAKVHSDEDLRNFVQLSKAWQAFLTANSNTLAISQEGNKALAISSVKEDLDLRDAIRNPLNALIKFNHDGAKLSSSEVSDAYTQSINLFLFLFIISILIGIGFSIFLTRIISKPLAAVTQNISSVAEGDLTVELIKVKSKDEIGQLAFALNEMVINLRDLIGHVSQASKTVVASSEVLMMSSEQTSKATEQISIASQEIASGTEQQVQKVNQTQNVVEQVSNGMKRLANSIHSVTEYVSHANQSATQGNQVVFESVNKMNLIREKVQSSAQILHSLGEKSKEIGQIVTLITGIAKQTNLLSLNASIEAARVGEEGRGFAVVAGEIGKLAKQSGEAAQKIRELIQDVQVETQKANQAMNEGTKAVDDGVLQVRQTGDSFERIARMIEEVTVQSEEVSTIIKEVNAGSQGMVGIMEVVASVSIQAMNNTQNMVSSVEEQLASMEEINSSAISLAKMADELQVLVSKFKV